MLLLLPRWPEMALISQLWLGIVMIGTGLFIVIIADLDCVKNNRRGRDLAVDRKKALANLAGKSALTPISSR